MAIINCPECGFLRSDKAPICRRCEERKELHHPRAIQHIPQEEEDSPSSPAWPNMLVFYILPLLLFVTAAGYLSYISDAVQPNMRFALGFPFLWIFGLVITSLLIMAFLHHDVRSELEAALGAEVDFTPSQIVWGATNESGLAISEERESLILVKATEGKTSIRPIPYKDLLSVELDEDGQTSNSSVRTSQIGGAIAGGLLLGGAGAIIGGLSGRRRSRTQVSRITLRLIVRDTEDPIHEVVLMDYTASRGIDKDSAAYKESIKKARHWFGLLKVIIDRIEALESDKHSGGEEAESSVQPKSVAEEIKQLAELVDSGALSQEEFEKYKAKLLDL